LISSTAALPLPNPVCAGRRLSRTFAGRRQPGCSYRFGLRRLGHGLGGVPPPRSTYAL